MLEGLKKKIFSVRRSLEESVTEVPPEESGLTGPASSCIEEEGVDREETQEPVDLSFTEPEAGKKREPSLIRKVSTLVREREFIISSKNLDDPLFELEMSLLESDVALVATDAIIDHVRKDLVGSKRKIGRSIDDVITKSLSDALLSVLGEGFDLISYIQNHPRPVKILFTGVNGTGKTTTIAKVAQFLTKQGFSVVLGAGDTFRAGAIEQIDVHGKRQGLKVIAHQEGSDPSAVLFDTVAYAKAHGIDVVLGDTAGRFHNKANLMNQLAKIKRVIEPDLVLYVDEAVAGNDAVVRARDFADTVGMDGIILTKVDMDPKGGAAISIAYAAKKPLFFIGTGQGYDDIVAFDPVSVVDELLSGEA